MERHLYAPITPITPKKGFGCEMTVFCASPTTFPSLRPKGADKNGVRVY
jgi:hypothetical protein